MTTVPFTYIFIHNQVATLWLKKTCRHIWHTDTTFQNSSTIFMWGIWKVEELPDLVKSWRKHCLLRQHEPDVSDLRIWQGVRWGLTLIRPTPAGFHPGGVRGGFDPPQDLCVCVCVWGGVGLLGVNASATARVISRRWNDDDDILPLIFKTVVKVLKIPPECRKLIAKIPHFLSVPCA